MSTIHKAIRRAERERKESKPSGIRIYLRPIIKREREDKNYRLLLLFLIPICLLIFLYNYINMRPKGIEANSILDSSIREKSPQKDPLKDELKREFREALRLQESHRLEDAIRIYTDIIEKDPTQYEALNNLGVIYIEKGMLDSAEQCFRKAIVVKEDYVDPYYNLACLMVQKGEEEDAIRYLNKAFSLDKGVSKWIKQDHDLDPIKDRLKAMGIL